MSGSAVGASGVLALILGFAVILAGFVPYVAWSYRRYGTVQPAWAVLLVVAVVYAIGLWTYTILPLPPDPQQWCALHAVMPQLRPLQFVRDIRGEGAAGPLNSPALLQVLLNVVLFIPLGALLRVLLRWSLARTAAAGLVVSLVVELTQLTGDWGLYPCAYRLFDVDDLLVNTLGAVVGGLVAPVLARSVVRPVGPAGEGPGELTAGRRLLGMLADVISVEVLGLALWAVVVLLGAATAEGVYPVPPLWQRALFTEVLPALLLLLLVPALSDGVTVGQRATRVRWVSAEGRRPSAGQVVVRFLTGSGGFFLIMAADDVVPGGGLGSLAILLGISSLVLAWRSQGHRGLSGVVARLWVVDARGGPAETEAVLSQGPAWELRRMSTAVLGLAAAAYVALAVTGALTQAFPTVGPVIVLVLVIAFAVLTVALALYLVANGMTMVRRERRSLGNLLSLLTGLGSLGLLAAAGLVLAVGPRWLVVLAVAALALSGYLGFLFTAFVGYGLLYGRLLPAPGADVVVALGSGLRGSRVPPLLASRLDRTVEVLDDQRQHGRRSWVICSGGRGAGEDVTEASAMAAYLRERGVPGDLILEEGGSRSTEENLRFSWVLAQSHGGGPLVAVTNDFHAFRAALIARELGIPAQVVGAPTARYYFPSAVLREFLAVLARNRLRYATVGLLLAACTGALTHVVLA